MPKVSVIIPTYNRALLIRRAIASVLRQTYQDFEIIVIDDCSDDNTHVMVENFKDKRIRYIKHLENKGSAAARNTGIKIAQGEYIAFQDSDDEWLPEKLERQMNVFNNAPPEVGVVYTRFKKIKNNKRSYLAFYWVAQKEGDIHNNLLNGNYITTSTTVIKRECFDKTGMFDESLPRFQDWELWLRISRYYHFKCSS